ncbi:MAG: AEC family transporter [Ruminococcaceae bacterium]|nr:AEC family transporter [Oscillospiraceae bacterium]
MLSSFLTVGEQVLILFVLIAVGFICGKTKLITEAGSKVMADIVFYFVTPCVIISAFQREFDVTMLIKLLVSAFASAVILFFSVLVAQVLYKSQSHSRACILKFATVFSNCGYMSLPLQQALLGDDGVFYGASFVAIFNIFVWSYGIITMKGNNDKASGMKILINPGIIGTLVGVVLFLCSVELPRVIAQPINYLAALNSPVPMLIIGFYLANANLKKAFTDVWSYISMALRLVVLPLITLLLLLLCGIKGPMLVSLVISVSSPVAAITTMMSAKYGHDTELSVSIVSASTLLSLVTMPLIVGLAGYLS